MYLQIYTYEILEYIYEERMWITRKLANWIKVLLLIGCPKEIEKKDNKNGDLI